MDMKKSLCALAACAAMLFALSACEAGSVSAPSGSSAPASTPQSSSVPVSSVSSGEKSAAPDAHSAVPVDADALDAMMSALEGYEPGTAGASLKLYTAACGVLNFSEGYSEDQEASLRSALEEALAEMPQERLSLLKETFPAVDGAARGIVENGVGSVADILADAGDPNEYTSYDAGKYDSVRAILCDALGVQD